MASYPPRDYDSDIMSTGLTREEIERQLVALAREFAKSHDPQVRKEIERLSLLHAKRVGKSAH
jgi:hypothetical protein